MTVISVLAIDPGKTTGYAFGSIDTNLKFMEVYPWQQEDGHLEFYDTLENSGAEHLVCESFEFRQGKQKTGLELYSRELIGVLNFFQQKQYHTPWLWFQTAAKGKSYFDNDKLKELGIYVKGKPHAMDATRHLMQWITFEAGYRYGVENVALASALVQLTRPRG